MKRPLATAVLVLAAALSAAAADLPRQKDFIKANLPAGGKLSRMTVTVEADKAAVLKDTWGVAPAADRQYEFIVSKDGTGAVTGAVYLATVYVTGHRSVHHIGIALNGDGSIKDIAVLAGSDDWARKVARKAFLGQFSGKEAAKLTAYKDVLAVTGATVSSETMVDEANLAMGVFALYVK